MYVVYKAYCSNENLKRKIKAKSVEKLQQFSLDQLTQL